MLIQSSPGPRGSSTPLRAHTALANPTNPGSARKNRPNITQNSPARVFFQPGAASCSGVLAPVAAAGLAAGRAAGAFDRGCLPGLGSSSKAGRVGSGGGIGAG